MYLPHISILNAFTDYYQEHTLRQLQFDINQKLYYKMLFSPILEDFNLGFEQQLKLKDSRNIKTKNFIDKIGNFIST